MSRFDNIKEALVYIDGHLDESITFESLAARFHFSPYYFHRMFSIIVGKTVTAHIRDRRLTQACLMLNATDGPVINIAMDCGFNSAQAFSRAFKERFGLTPSEYRRQGLAPVIVTAEELIVKFTNRLRGGILLNPRIIKRDKLIIAGVSGDGSKTGEVWYQFKLLTDDNAPENKLSDNGYEIRIYSGDGCTVHVGYAVSDNKSPGKCTLYELPASQYAVFDVYVANGYDSENTAMDEWLTTNSEGYKERLLPDGAHYCVEYYDERFNGEESGSIVEIWIPVMK
jgi:AraC-like DNA-binding protein/predicted transcriptional regulator YdeE